MNYIILLVFCSPLSISSPFSWFSCCSDTVIIIFVCFPFLFLSFLRVSVCVCVHTCVLSSSVVSDSLWPHGLQSTRLLCPWNFPGKNIGVGYTLLLQVIFWTQGLKLHLLCLLHWQMDSLPLHFLTFLVLQGASGLYCIFPATVFKSAIYLMSTGFIWRQGYLKPRSGC